MKKKLVAILTIILYLFVNQISYSQTWLTALAQGVDDAPASFVEAVIEFQGEIIIAGEFHSVSGVPVEFVAKWNGSAWQAMGSGLPAVARCLAIYNGELYAGLDNIGVNTLYKWDGSAWVSSGPFMGPIQALYVDPVTNDFYAGGLFTAPGRFIAKFDGSSWAGMGNLPDGSSSFPGVRAINVFNGDLYVGGTFGGGTTTQYCAKWNGSSFVQLHSDQPNNAVNAFTQKDGKLILGGSFSRVGSSPNPFTPSVIGWDGSEWAPLTTDQSGPVSSFGGVKALTVYKNQIYAAGSFSSIFSTGIEVNNVARYNDCSWKNLTDGASTIGLNNTGYCLAVVGDDLYIGGEFTQAGDDPNSKRIAGWNNIVECPDPICFAASPSISIAADQTSGCIGTTFNFTSSVEDEGTAPVYDWKVDGISAGVNSPTFSSSSLTDGQVVTCDLTSNDPCMSNPTSTSNSIQVTIVSQLIPDITISASQTTFCPGTTVNFTSTSTNEGTSPSYQWMIDGVNTGTNSPDFSSSALTDGQIITCQLTSSESCANPVTALSNAITMTVSSSVTPAVSITASETTFCTGTSVSFTASPVNGGSNPSFQWMIDGSNVGTNSTNFTTTGLNDGQSVSCILTSNDACASPNTATSNSITVSVSSVTPSISISASQTSICVGDDVQFSSTITNGGSNPSYQWQVNGTDIGTNSPTFNSSSITDGQVITCTLTSSDACASPTSVSSNSVTINTTGVTPTISISANQTSICAGETVIFSASSTNGGSAPTYQWQVDGINTGSNSATFSTSSITDGQSVTCVLTSNENCLNQNNILSNSISITVNTSAIPSVTIASNSNEVCAGTQITFTATAVNPGTNPSYTWFHNNAVVGTNSSTYSASNFENGDFVYCKLVSSGSCGGNSSDISNFVILNIINEATISSNGITLSCLTPGTSYQWVNCDTNEDVPGATSASFTPSVGGTYKVRVQLNNCTVESFCSTILIVGLTEADDLDHVSIYPNPTKDQVTIQSDGEAIVSYELLDVRGISIGKSEPGNFQNETIEMSKYANGTYFIRLYFEGGIQKQFRVVKN